MSDHKHPADVSTCTHPSESQDNMKMCVIFVSLKVPLNKEVYIFCECGGIHSSEISHTLDPIQFPKVLANKNFKQKDTWSSFNVRETINKTINFFLWRIQGIRQENTELGARRGNPHYFFNVWVRIGVNRESQPGKHQVFVQLVHTRILVGTIWNLWCRIAGWVVKRGNKKCLPVLIGKFGISL